MTQNDEEHANVALLNGPLTIREAMQCEDANKWEQGMQEEYKSLMANGTWELTPVPHNCSPFGCKWVFCAKRDVIGPRLLRRSDEDLRVPASAYFKKLLVFILGVNHCS